MTERTTASYSMWTTWRPVWLAALITLPLGVLVFVLAGAGHGTLLPLLILFPFGPLAALVHGPMNSSDVAGVVAALLELPLYALMVRAGARMGRIWMGVGVVIIVHVLAMAVAAPRMW